MHTNLNSLQELYICLLKANAIQRFQDMQRDIGLHPNSQRNPLYRNYIEIKLLNVSRNFFSRHIHITYLFHINSF